MKIDKCQAKDPNLCPYHGAALRMEKAVAEGNMNEYFNAKADFNKAGRDFKLTEEKRSGFLGLVKTLVETESQVTPTNPFRFEGEIEIKPQEGKIGIAHTIHVHAATRAEVYDKLVVEAKKFVDELRESKKRVSMKKWDYTMSIKLPHLDGRKDDDYSYAGGQQSLDNLVSSVAHHREMAVRFFNSDVLAKKIYDGTATSEEKKLYNDDHWSFDATEEELISGKYDATKWVWQGETEEQRAARQKHDDYVRGLLRESNRRSHEERKKNEAKVARQEAAAAEKKKAARGGSASPSSDDGVTNLLFQTNTYAPMSSSTDYRDSSSSSDSGSSSSSD